MLAVFYLWLAKPDVLSLTMGAAFLIVGLVMRGLASGHLRKNEQLTTTGPYAYTRNPLYLGSAIMAIGFAIIARSLWIVLMLAAVFVAIYLPVIRAEEAYLARNFPEFSDYARQVPRLIPGLRKSSGAPGSFSWSLYWKHREYNATLGSAVTLAIMIAKLFWGAR